MKRIAILHIGPSKTGSTSIQSTLKGYDDGSTFYATFKHPNHSIHMRTAFRGDLEETRRKLKKQYRAEFSAMLERRDRDRIIVSGESIWKLDGADKAEMVEFIRRRGWEVQVVAYMREPASRTASRLSQRLRSGKGGNIPDKVHERYRRGLSAFMELLPPEHLHVRPFGGDVLADFRRTFGLDLSGVKVERRNQSLSLATMRLLHVFDKSSNPFRRDPDVDRERRRFAEMIAEKYAGPATLDPALCEGIADWSEADWLYENFGIDFRRNASPGSTKADLEAALDDLDGVDLSGLDELLAGYGIRCENFPTAEAKLHRLFHAVLTEKTGRDWTMAELRESMAGAAPVVQRVRAEILFRNPGKNLVKSFHFRALKRLSKSRFLAPVRRDALARKASDIRERWIAGRQQASVDWVGRRAREFLGKGHDENG